MLQPKTDQAVQKLATSSKICYIFTTILKHFKFIFAAGEVEEDLVRHERIAAALADRLDDVGIILRLLGRAASLTS